MNRNVSLVCIALLALFIGLHCESAYAIDVGETPADFTLPTNHGTPVSLSSLKGKIVYVDFWASWCASCAQSIPWLGTLQKKIGSDAFQILAVNLDEHSNDAESFLKSKNVDLLVAYDPAGKTAESLKVNAMPTAMLLDKNGKVLLVHEGFKEADADALESEIRKALKQ